MYKVVLTDDRFGDYEDENRVLQEIDAEIEVNNFENEREAIEGLKDADGVFVNLFPLTKTIISAMSKCKVITRYGVGVDNVDVQAATEAGIQVTNVPDYCYEEVSDQALALLLGVIRKITYKDREIRKGRWHIHSDKPCYKIRGNVLGIIGYGSIGRTFHRKASGLGFSKVLVYDPYVPEKYAAPFGAEKVELDRLLRESDYISIHAALTEETRGMIEKNAIAKMKPGVMIVNTARGPICNQQDILAALKAEKIAGAGLDVFETEPLPKDSEFFALDNVIISDHAGFYSVDSIIELKTKAARNIVEMLTGKRPTYPVNHL